VEQNYWNIIKEDEYVDQLIAVDSWICKLKPALLELILKLIYEWRCYDANRLRRWSLILHLQNWYNDLDYLEWEMITESHLLSWRSRKRREEKEKRREKERVLRGLSRFWCSVKPKVATVTVTAVTAVGTVGVARDDEGGKYDGSQVLISAFRRDARDSKRRKNGWDVAGQEQGKLI